MTIELTVIGSGYGEACVLAFDDDAGKRRFGIVDGYSSEAPTPAQNPLVRLLKQLDGFEGRLDFVIVTHPHLDHLDGLWQVLEEFKVGIDLIGYWGGPDFEYQAAYFQKLADQLGSDELDLHSHARQVYHLLGNIKRLRDRTGDRPELESNVGIRQLYPIGRAGAGSALTITSFSPCFDEATAFHSMVTDCVKGRRATTIEHEWGGVNRTSLGLYLAWHDVRMLLGGDVETANWRAALSGLPEADYPPVHVFKISHHGSPNGMAAGMWLPARRWVRSSPQPTIAVVTPYSRSAAPRPDPNVLTEIKNAGCSVYITGRVPGALPVGGTMEAAFRAAFHDCLLPSWISIRLTPDGRTDRIESSSSVRRM